MKKIKYLFLLLYLVCFPCSVSAQNYDITNYYVDVNVNENNVYDISEYYNVIFDKSANFTRNISLKPKVYLTNDKFITYVTKVDKLEVSEDFDVNINSKNYEVKISDAYKDVGKSISISYAYNMGHDLDEKKDIVFLNILDGSFVPLTDEIVFDITLPANIEKETVEFYIDGKKVKSEEKFIYYASENHVEGIIRHEFKKGELIGIQITLPNGTFKNTVSNENAANYLLLVIPFITLIISFLVNKKYKKENKHRVKDIYKIADIFDSAEIAYLYKGNIQADDIVSIVFRLANDGYISFKNYGSKDNIIFKIKKEKEYDKDNAIQKIVFDGLFQNKEEVDIRDIEGTFYPYYIDAKRTLDNFKNDNKIFYKNVDKIKKFISGISYIGVVLLQINPLYNLLDSKVFAIITSIAISILFVVIFKIKNKIYKYISRIIFLIIVIIEIYALLALKMNLVIYTVGIILTTLTLILESIIQARTIYGNQIKYEIDLFRTELLGMSDEEFDLKLKEDEQYFFDMIPYMIVFNSNNWWFNKFIERIEVEPIWYESSEIYTKEKIKMFIDEIIYQLTVAIQVNKTRIDELLNQAPNKLL